MMIISHRGNLSGPNPEKENHPDYINAAIEAGYFVEVDVWHANGQLFLGHDCPQYSTSAFFLNRSSVICHAKNRKALEVMLQEDIHCFWHDSDRYTLTSNGLIWAYPGQLGGKLTIAVMPDTDQDISLFEGVCTDYPVNY